MKKDDYLATLMQIPPKQKTEIKPFTQKTSREAFSVSLDGLKGVCPHFYLPAAAPPTHALLQWNIHTLVAESSQAREDRKRRVRISLMLHAVASYLISYNSAHPDLQKELKKLAKAQGQAIPLPPAVPSTPSGVPATPGGAPTQSAASAPAAAAVPPRSSTPRPGAPKLPPAHQQPPQPRGRTPVGIGTPQSVSTPGPTAAAPPTQPAPTGQPPPQRGVKREREREESGAMQANGNLPPVAHGTGPGPGMGQREGVKIAKAGVPGARPRPVKKQRLVRPLLAVLCLLCARDRPARRTRPALRRSRSSSRRRTRRRGGAMSADQPSPLLPSSRLLKPVRAAIVLALRRQRAPHGACLPSCSTPGRVALCRPRSVSPDSGSQCSTMRIIDAYLTIPYPRILPPPFPSPPFIATSPYIIVPSSHPDPSHSIAQHRHHFPHPHPSNILPLLSSFRLCPSSVDETFIEPGYIC